MPRKDSRCAHPFNDGGPAPGYDHRMMPPSSDRSNRAAFLRASALGVGLLGASALVPRLFAREPNDPFRGLKLGVASYSFRKFTLDQAIAMTVELGLKYIGLKEFHLKYDSSPAELKAAAAKVRAAGLTLLGGGVVYFRNTDEREIRGIFEYAKGAGMPVLVCSPVPAALDMIERMAVAYDIVVAIHNHGPGDRNYPLPLDAWRMVEHRDKRMGVCIDVGHTVRAGGDAVAAIRRCAPRLYDFHLKDVSAARPEGKNMVFGTGVIDFPAVLRALLEIKFTGHLQIEYEATPENPLPGMKESVAYLKRVLAGF